VYCVCLFCLFVFFFFSSRRRHTRCYRDWSSDVCSSDLFVGSAVGVGALWAFTILPRSLPSVTALETLQPVQGSRIYDDNDEPMTELHVERRIFVPLAQIPPALRDAIIATEDRRVYSHWGVDPIGIARPVVQHHRRGRIVE